MADIVELVIKIPENYYEVLKTLPDDQLGIECAIKYGIPLPKGHGDLCDKEDVKANHHKWLGYLDEDMITRLNIAVDRHIKTLIKGSKEQE